MNETAKGKIVLLDNLMARMEYNSTQKTWKLSGAITMGEQTALAEVLYFYRHKIFEAE